MTLFKKYSDYKNTGIPWIRNIPSGWQKYRLKNTLRTWITDGPHLTPEFIDDGIPFLSVDGIQNGELVFNECRYISHSDHIEFSKKAKPEPGDILMGKAASTGKIARVKVNFDFSIWSPLALIKIDEKRFSSPFIEYYLKSPEAQYEIDRLCTSNTQKNISMDDIPSIFICAPSIKEQNEIANFLHYEILKIDELIRRQEKLIELLEEKRKAVIKKTLNYGLNPNSEFIDSGVSWIGDTPKHWKISALKRFCDVRDGTHATPGYVDVSADSHPLVTSKDINDGIISTEYAKHISREDYLNINTRSGVGIGDVLMPMIGTVGGAAIVRGLPNYAIKNVALFKCSESLNAEFLCYLLDSDIVIHQFDLFSAGGVQSFVSLGILRSLVIPIPSYSEQLEIVNYLNESVKKINLLVDKSKLSITLLKEHRASLISEAVTGQIDVRNYQIKEAA